ncbi:MAG: TldD/PmbA family protein [Planctomycetota bacterium]
MSTLSPAARAPFEPRELERELLARCRSLTERALASGAAEAETFGTRSKSIGVRFEKGDLKLTQVDDGSTLGLRVFRDKRLGFASTNQADERSLATTARDALDLASFARPDEHNRLPAPRPVTALAPLVEPALAALTVEEAVELGRAFVARVRALDPRISVDNAGFDVACVTHAIAASTGVALAESDAQASFSVFGMAVDGEDVGGFHYDGDALRRLVDLEPALDRVARDFVDVSVGNLRAGTAESYRGPVLFAPDAFVEVFVAPLLSAASAIAVQRKRSPLAGKLGEAVAAPVLEIVDDPHERTLAGAGAFDREGQPTARTPLVERGVLRTFLYNGYAAAVEGRSSTGHAKGGARGVPGLGVHAVSIGGGRGGDRDAMLARLGRGLFVQRFSGTIDPASGDFSGVAKSARWVEGGRVVRSLKETLLSGNAFALLKEMTELSTTRERLSGSALAPFALVDGVSVTAG